MSKNSKLIVGRNNKIHRKVIIHRHFSAILHARFPGWHPRNNPLNGFVECPSTRQNRVDPGHLSIRAHHKFHDDPDLRAGCLLRIRHPEVPGQISSQRFLSSRKFGHQLGAIQYFRHALNRIFFAGSGYSGRSRMLIRYLPRPAHPLQFLAQSRRFLSDLYPPWVCQQIALLR